MAIHSGRTGICSNVGMTVASEILTPRRHRGASVPVEQKQVRSELRFDELRLREWFNQMDLDRRGHVSKTQFIHFLVSQPWLQKLFVEDRNPQLNVAPNGWQQRVVCAPMLSKIWRELCENRPHEQEMEWRGFSNFFRRRGMLIHYKTKHNPKDRLASMLADMHIQPLEQDSQTLDEFVRLRRTHLQGQQKKQLGIKELSENPQVLESLGTPAFSRRGARNGTI